MIRAVRLGLVFIVALAIISKLFNKPETGYFFVMRAETGSVDASKLRVRESDSRLVDDAGRPVADYPYLVFSIEASEQRDDWFLIPDVLKAHKALQQAVRSGKRKDAESALTVFKRAALTSPDLLIRDAKRLVEMIESEVIAAMPASMTSIAKTRLKDLKAINLFSDKPVLPSRANRQRSRRSRKVR